MVAELDLRQLFQQQANNLLQRLKAKSRDPALAEDLLQDAFVRLLERQSDDHSGSAAIQNSTAYLNRVANNLLLDHYRSQQARQTEPYANDELSEMAETASQTDNQVGQQQQLEHMRQLLAQMPLRTRQVFQLCRIQGKSYAEAADHLDISVSSVQKHLTRALDYLTQALERSN